MYYETNYNEFPERLEPQREAELLECFTSTHDPDAKSNLVYHNLRFVAYIASNIAKKFAYTGIERDELISIGTIGLMKAVDNYNPQKGALATYASKCIQREMIDFLREFQWYNTTLHFEDVLSESPDGNELTLGDTIADDQAEAEFYGYEEAEAFACRVCTVLNQLPLREIEIVLLYASGITEQQIGERMGFSQSYLSRIRQKIIIRSRREHHLSITKKDRDIFFDIDSDTFCAVVNPQSRHKLELEGFFSYDVKIVDLGSGYTKFQLPIEEDSYKFYAAMARTLRTA